MKAADTIDHKGDEDDEIVILKIGGSSITHKAKEETLNDVALEWFAKLISSSVDPTFLSSSLDDGCCSRNSRNISNGSRSTKKKKKKQFIVVHGAGSFGHHSAKRFGLRCGKAVFLKEIIDHPSSCPPSREEALMKQRYQMEGLSKTRQSVQKLNAATVNYLIQHGVNAVGISPGITIHGLRAHGATAAPTGVCASNASSQDESYRGMQQLCDIIQQCLQTGLVPVIHGDACLLYDGERAGILGGDTIAEGLAKLWNRRHVTSKISQVIFITDVAGVFTSDPKSDPNAELIRSLTIHKDTGNVVIENKDSDDSQILNVSGSSHEHDVTGGLKVVLIALCEFNISHDYFH
jgi:isopentenyl phosphate kinase